MTQTAVSTTFTLLDHAVRVKNHEGTDYICLNDLWRAAGSPENRTPYEWLRLPQTKELSKEVDSDINTGLSRILAERGRYGGTYAIPTLALSYAKYLSPKLHLQVNETYLRARAGDVTLAEEIVERAPLDDQKRHLARVTGMVARADYTRVLKEHGVEGYGYGLCTNAVYKGLFDMEAKQIREAAGLPAKANVRKHMTTERLVDVMFAERLASKRIADNDDHGNLSCSLRCHEAATEVRALVGR